MFSFLTNLFSESGSISMMRVLSFICVITASAIALYAIIEHIDLNPVSILCGTFLGAGISGKVIQKNFEAKDVDRR